MRKLEQRLGVRLLDRTTRSVAPTEAGRALLIRIEPLFAEIDNALTDLVSSADRPAGRVRISAPRVAIPRFIAPILGSFHEAYPDIELEISTDDTLTDIVAERFDAGIRLGERLEKDMVAVKLGGDVSSAVVASPEYLDCKGTPSQPSDLHAHDCIRFRWPGSGSIYRWEFEFGGRAIEIAVDGPLVADDVGLMLIGAEAGVGIAYALETDARPSIDSGRLVRLLQPYCPAYPGFYLYHTSKRHMTPALRAFIDHCVEHARRASRDPGPRRPQRRWSG
jgi:DNA-binding transcriptional LysR family regulator